MQLRTSAGRALLAVLVAMLVLAAVADAAPGRQDAYPAQATPDPLLPMATSAAYPATGLDVLPTPAPLGEQDTDPNAGRVAVPESAPSQAVATTSGGGLLYLWLGFVATLLIFGASVIGATMIFTRRVED